MEKRMEKESIKMLADQFLMEYGKMENEMALEL